MIPEKNLEQKILWHCPFKAKHQRTQKCLYVTSQNFIKILSLETSLKKQKSRVNVFFEQKYTRIYSSIYSRVFTKSIISHPFLKYFHRNNSIYKITSPSYGVKEEICRRMPQNFSSSAQFQRKRKSLVFFQSLNFLCLCLSSVLKYIILFSFIFFF